MRPSECGFASPPLEDTRDREALDRFGEFLRLVGSPRTVTPFGRWLVANDPEMRGFVHGAFPLTLADVR